MWTFMVTSSPFERYDATSGSFNPSGVTYFKCIERLICLAASPYKSSTRPLIKTPRRFKPAREISIITEARGLACRFRYLCVWEEVGMYMSLSIRRNHIGKMWMSPSLSSVAKFAIRVFERSSSISVELRTGGLVAAASDIQIVISPPSVTRVVAEEEGLKLLMVFIIAICFQLIKEIY
jgi:hypothetical protein